jgi:hypothetical protein
MQCDNTARIFLLTDSIMQFLDEHWDKIDLGKISTSASFLQKMQPKLKVRHQHGMYIHTYILHYDSLMNT